jgi:hypothetical protein
MTMDEVARVIPRMLDYTQSVPPRDARHEEAPPMPTPERSPSEKIGDESIRIVDQAASRVLETYQQLKDEIAAAEQMILNSQMEVRDTIRNHMKIVSAASEIQKQVKAQIVDANKLLRGNGHG